MGVTRGLLYAAVLVVFLGLYARPRFPEPANNVWLKTIVGLHIQLIHYVSVGGGLVGLSPINITRTMTDVSLLLNRPAWDVQEERTTMDGVEVIIFRSVDAGEGRHPGIIHIHGGGWALLSPDHYGPVCRELARETKAVVISINYRLAPEHLFPVPLEDCLKVTKYFLRNAEQYDVDPGRVGLKGDSAGGNLAMAVALNLSRDGQLPSLRALSLDYPAIQMFTFDLPSYHKYEVGPGFLTKTIMINYWLTYIYGHRKYFNIVYNRDHIDEQTVAKHRDNFATDLLPPFIRDENVTSSFKMRDDYKQDKEQIQREITAKILNPMLAPLMSSDEDLATLPPTHVLTTEFDALRDEGFLLVERMRRAGVSVSHSYLPAEEHGFLNFVDIDVNAEREMEKTAQFFIKCFETQT
ncbi:AAAD-like protein [Mya arenaria]|uniref:AAAD-like protein n=1 Tax=Mya arenaria TaxID=6604 RepID=A0ABY7DT03_MYAAR|nr:arylacetamide deacetylase-like [Mya arenaria]WAR00853.1 AAAD-like protein [Mya arenaria]